MYNHNFPVTIIDNFLDDPYGAVELANSVEYKVDPDGRWPGKRSVHIGEFAPVFFQRVLKKFFAVFYDVQTDYEFFANMHFQKIPGSLKDGWIHNDIESWLSGIIYLNTQPSLNSGTSIIMPNNVNWDNSINIEVKKECYKNNTDNDEAREENNSQFHDSIIVKNRFNRLIAFDGHINHKANFDIGPKNKERLTLVFFVNKFVPSTYYPLHRLRMTV